MHLIIFNIILFTSGSIYAEKQQYQVVESLADKWVFYDEKYAAYVPYVENLHQNVKVISQTLNCTVARNSIPVFNKGQRNLISFFGSKNLCLFINHKLCFTSDKRKQYIFDIDSIASGIISENRSVFISFWHPDGDLPFNEIYKITPKTTEIYDIYPNSAATTVLSIEGIPYNDYFLIITLIICIIYVLLKSRYSKTFQNFFNINSIFSPSNIEANKLFNPLASVNLYFMLAFCFLLSFVLQIIEYLPVHASKIGITALSEFINLHRYIYLFLLKFFKAPPPIISLFVVTLLIFSVLVIKYYILLIFSWLLKCRQLVKYHYLDNIRLLQIFGLIILPLIAFLVFKNIVSEEFISKFIFYNLILFLCFIMFRTIILINKLTSFRNIHLFYYLCATELIPSVILIKLIL